MTNPVDTDPRPTYMPISDLRATGMLWLINRVVFHPRGYALALHRDDAGDILGWSMLGDGRKPWWFHEADDRDCFAKAEAFLASVTEHSGIEEATR